MKYCLSPLILVTLILLSTNALAANPMFRTESVETKEQPNKPVLQYPGIMQRFINYINSVQKMINSTLSSSITRIKEGSISTLLFLMLISFVYGLVHAIGPGHGKTIISSYFLSQQAKISKGAVSGLAVALVHSLSAVILIGVIYIIFKTSFLLNFERLNLIIQKISYTLITGIGFYLFVSAIIGIIKKGNTKNGHPVDDHGTSDKKSFAAVILSSGMVPCPGAAMILLFTMNMDIFYAGMLSVLFMSLGMAVTIATSGILAILIKKFGIIATKRSHITAVFHKSTEIISGLLILFIGIILLLGTL